MIMQLSALLGPLLEAGIGFGTQFLNRELGRGARREQKDLLKAQARATGGGSFVDAQSPGTVSSAFRTPAPIPQTTFAGTTLGAGFNLPGSLGVRLPRGGGIMGPFPLQTGVLQRPSNLLGAPIPAGTAPFATSRSERFVLDKESGCLRLKQPGEKGATFKLDTNGDFVRVRARRINPFNKSAAKRASRRIDATINAMADLVRVSKKRDKGKSVGDGQVVSFRTKKRRKRA